jgi:hypothetical protein
MVILFIGIYAGIELRGALPRGSKLKSLLRLFLSILRWPEH